MDGKWVLFHEYGEYKVFVDIPFEKVKIKFKGNESPEVFKANPFEISRKECQEICGLRLKESFSFSLKEKSKKMKLEESELEVNQIDYKKAKTSVFQNPELAFNIHKFFIQNKIPITGLNMYRKFIFELYETAGASLTMKAKKDKNIESVISSRIVDFLKENEGYTLAVGEILKYAPDNFEILNSFLMSGIKNAEFEKLVDKYSNISPVTFKRTILVWMEKDKSIRLNPLNKALRRIVKKKINESEDYFGYTDAFIELYGEGFFPKNVCENSLLFSTEKEVISFDFLKRYSVFIDPLKYYKNSTILNVSDHRNFFNWLEKEKPGYLKEKINDFLIFNLKIFRYLEDVIEKYRDSIDCNLVKKILYPDLSFIRKFPEMVDFNLIELETLSNFSDREMEKFKPFISENLMKKLEEYKGVIDV